ncbi:MAG: hypothetical protein KAH33_00080 [Candidatus Delongbacteria bacterium]|nr:hypothetical protein [Candidatus Delongbacteria bacterium]
MEKIMKLLLLSLFTLPVLLFAQQASSTNYKLLDYGLFNGSLEGDNKPASTNYIAESNTVGVLSGDDMTSANYNNDPGYYLGPLTGEILPPEDVTIIVENDSSKISWSAVPGATSYKVYFSSDPYENFTEDTLGNFSGTSWSILFTDEKKFYYVIAIK